ECGITLVRMGEFAWSHLEKREGEYSLRFLDEAVRIFGEQGIRSILCTPSSAAPAWMCRKYPEILRVNRQGQKAWFGVRDHTCYTSPRYREKIAGIVRELACCFKENPFVAGWQIDNEVGCSRFPECFCPDCQRAFREYLAAKFHSLEALNEAWATPFWSGEYYDWEEISLEGRAENMHGGAALESKRFRSQMQADFVLFQADLIRQEIPGAVIGTNNYSGGADPYKLFSALDYAGNDFYPNYYPDSTLTDPVYHAFLLALYGGYKSGQAPWIMETPAGVGFPMKDLTAFYFWLCTACGYEKIFYFPWNCAPNGNEKIHTSVVDSSGEPGPQYEILKDLLQEQKRILQSFPEPELPQSDCAVVNDPDCGWIYSGSVPGRMDVYARKIYDSFAAAFYAAGYTHLISKEDDFSRYKLIVFPMQCHITEHLEQKIRAFAEQGGVVVLSGCAGCFDENGNFVERGKPEHLQEFLGLEITEQRPFRSPEALHYEESEEFFRDHPVVRGCLNGKELSGTPGTWTAYIKLRGAQPLLRFVNSRLEGLPFCTVHACGKGKILYFASDRIDLPLYKEILCSAAASAGIRKPLHPDQILTIRRGELLFVFNFGKEKVLFETDLQGTDLLGKATLSQGRISLSGKDFTLIHLQQ
ncbi:MAG: beta-galactosidase, partial [Lentisphaeria bacterium]|nr:beta-galactosidase [Lentisphaeria bacterium]